MNTIQKTTVNANLFCRLFDGVDDPNRLAIEILDGQRISYGDLVARAGQIANVLVARGVKGILISPIDAVGVNAAYDAAKAGNVPIVSVARGSTSPNQTLHVAMDEK